MSIDFKNEIDAHTFIEDQRRHGVRFKMWVHRNRHKAKKSANAGPIKGYVVVRSYTKRDEEIFPRGDFIRKVYGKKLVSS